jgi:hypothetical protein
VGTGHDQPPTRADVDNSGSPITTCGYTSQDGPYNAEALFNSGDGRVLVFRVAGGCGGANPAAQAIWARVDGTTSIDVSASQCNRVDCNAPALATFQGAAADGSRILITTKQQLVDADIDETDDLYACDIPAGTPAPVGKANPCAALRQVSVGAPAGADVESVSVVSGDGAAAAFTAKGVLADNKDALGDKAVAGDHNLYLWRTDAAHPTGQTSFVARLETNDLQNNGQNPQTTPDGRYLVFTTASQLVPTDTDTARDVYRYDIDTHQLTRVSTNVFGVAGNGAGFDANVVKSTVSDDGQKIVFTTIEALSPADGNAEPDVYLWTPRRVSLISTGSVGSAAVDIEGKPGAFSIDGSGQNIYFESPGALTPADGDDQSDVYDARIGGGFSFAQAAPCSGAGGACQSHVPAPAPVPAPVTAQPPADPGNVVPKACPKGKVAKGNKCVKKKKHKKHSGKKNHGKKASHKQGGGK